MTVRFFGWRLHIDIGGRRMDQVVDTAPGSNNVAQLEESHQTTSLLSSPIDSFFYESPAHSTSTHFDELIDYLCDLFKEIKQSLALSYSESNTLWISKFQAYGKKENTKKAAITRAYSLIQAFPYSLTPLEQKLAQETFELMLTEL